MMEIFTFCCNYFPTSAPQEIYAGILNTPLTASTEEFEHFQHATKELLMRTCDTEVKSDSKNIFFVAVQNCYISMTCDVKFVACSEHLPKL